MPTYREWSLEPGVHKILQHPTQIVDLVAELQVVVVKLKVTLH